MDSGVAHKQTTSAVSFRVLKFSTLVANPPPVEITVPFRSHNSLTRSRSSWRNAASPFCAKISVTDFPVRSSMSVSVSMKSKPSCVARILPTDDLPVPMKPIRAMLRMTRELLMQSLYHKPLSGTLFPENEVEQKGGQTLNHIIHRMSGFSAH